MATTLFKDQPFELSIPNLETLLTNWLDSEFDDFIKHDSGAIINPIKIARLSYFADAIMVQIDKTGIQLDKPNVSEIIDTLNLLNFDFEDYLRNFEQKINHRRATAVYQDIATLCLRFNAEPTHPERFLDYLQSHYSDGLVYFTRLSFDNALVRARRPHPNQNPLAFQLLKVHPLHLYVSPRPEHVPIFHNPHLLTDVTNHLLDANSNVKFSVDYLRDGTSAASKFKIFTFPNLVNVHHEVFKNSHDYNIIVRLLEQINNESNAQLPQYMYPTLEKL